MAAEEIIEIRRKSAFHARLVNSPDKSLQGALWISSSETPTCRIRNICGFLQIDSQRTQIYFDKNNLFFYGTHKLLQRNFTRDLAHKDITTRLGTYKDRDLNPTYGVHSQADQAGFVAIPVDELGLSYTRKRMLDLLVEEAELALPRLVSMLEEVPVKLDTRYEKVNFRKDFLCVPTEIMQNAIRAGTYYRGSITKANTRRETVKREHARVIYDSHLGFPEWMNAYLRRHR